MRISGVVVGVLTCIFVAVTSTSCGMSTPPSLSERTFTVTMPSGAQVECVLSSDSNGKAIWCREIRP